MSRDRAPGRVRSEERLLQSLWTFADLDVSVHSETR